MIMKRKIEVGKRVTWGQLQRLNSEVPNEYYINNDFEGNVFIIGYREHDAELMKILRDIFRENLLHGEEIDLKEIG